MVPHTHALLDQREAFVHLYAALDRFLHGPMCDSSDNEHGYCRSCRNELAEAFAESFRKLSACAHCGRPATGAARSGLDRLCVGSGRDCFDKHQDTYGRSKDELMV